MLKDERGRRSHLMFFKRDSISWINREKKLFFEVITFHTISVLPVLSIPGGGFLSSTGPDLDLSPFVGKGPVACPRDLFPSAAGAQWDAVHRPAWLAERHAVCGPDLQVLWDINLEGLTAATATCGLSWKHLVTFHRPCSACPQLGRLDFKGRGTKTQIRSRAGFHYAPTLNPDMFGV